MLAVMYPFGMRRNYFIKRHPNLDPEEVSQERLDIVSHPMDIIPFTTDFNTDIRRQAYSRFGSYQAGYIQRWELVTNITLEPVAEVRQHICDTLFQEWHTRSEGDLVEFLEPFDVVAKGKLLENFFDIYLGVLHNVNKFEELVTNFRNRIAGLDANNELENVLCSQPVYAFVWFVLASRSHRRDDNETHSLNKQIKKRRQFWLDDSGLSICVETYHRLIRCSLGNPPYVTERDNRDEIESNDTKARKLSIYDSLVRLGCYIGLKRDDWSTLDPSMNNRTHRITGTFEPVFRLDEKYLNFLENPEYIFSLFATVLGHDEVAISELLASELKVHEKAKEFTKFDWIRVMQLFIGYCSVSVCFR